MEKTEIDVKSFLNLKKKMNCNSNDTRLKIFLFNKGCCLAWKYVSGF